MLRVSAQILVRPARATDALAVVDLLRGEEDLEVAFEPAEFFVAEESGVVVACARLKPLPDGADELASVVVQRELRGRGVGERVVRAALARARGPVHALALAPGFFGKLGFARVAETPPALKEKAEGHCASTGFVPMTRASDAGEQRAKVVQRYARIVLNRGASCCSTIPDSEAAAAYSDEELASLPQGAHLGLGTGNPVREAAPRAGETVVDLGSGAGVDVLLAARAVGPSGRAIGVDATHEMVAKARENARAAGASNAEFHLAPIEALPLADASADLVVSNCVINLSPDKPATLREAFRVLKSGGRFVVSDTLRVEAPPVDACGCGCAEGALTADEWREELARAGFADVRVDAKDPTGRFEADVGTATVRARKP